MYFAQVSILLLIVGSSAVVDNKQDKVSIGYPGLEDQK